MNDPGLNRRFLGWNRPILHSVAEELSDSVPRTGPLDLSDAIVVLPGRRAGRRLTELLLERAAASGRALRPPEITTVGSLPERLYAPEHPEPDPVLDRQAWREAFHQLDPSDLAKLTLTLDRREGGSREIVSALPGLARDLQGQVAAAGMSFREVAGVCRSQLGFSDHERWLVLADAQDRYRSILARHGVCHRAHAREEALSRHRISITRPLWIAGAPDLPPIVRRFVTALTTEDPVRILVGAPASLAHAFDSLGCLIPEELSEMRLGLPDEWIRIVSRPPDQADAVILRLIELEGRLPAEEITLGVPDPEVVPFLTERLEEQGIPTRYAAGKPLTRTAEYRALQDLAAYTTDLDFFAFGSLIRHPLAEGALLQRMKRPVAELSGLVDRYQAIHLQGRMDGGRLPAGGERVSDPLQPRVRDARAALRSLLSPLSGERRLAAWSPLLAELVSNLLSGHRGGRLPVHDGDLHVFVDAVGTVLDGFVALPPELDPPVPVVRALRLLLDQLGDEVVPPDTGADAVELLGWLELPLDDASEVVITGMNEPHVPQSVTADPFLPHSLRVAIGLLDNDARRARDLLYLRTIVETRERVTLVAGRWDGEGNPLLPSRLLFAEDPPALVRRVKTTFQEKDSEPPPSESSFEDSSEESPPESAPGSRRKGRFGPGEEQGELELDFGAETVSRGTGFQLPPESVLSAPAPPERIRVTTFRALLRDPYRYALEQVLGLKRVDDEARELDASRFGTLAHSVLEQFGRDEAADSGDVETVARALDRILDSEASSRFGDDPLPAVRLQVRQARARLRAFADWQVGWSMRGWRIRRTEASPPGGGAEFLVDGTPILLTGQMDRVDYNERTGKWCVLDYKTGDRVRTPDAAHRRGSGVNRSWEDLQLPLYRILAATLQEEDASPLISSEALGEVSVGYVALPRDLRVRELLADWNELELAEAEDVARAAVRRLRENRFVYDPEDSTIRSDEPLTGIVGGPVLRILSSYDDGREPHV